jgi:hypothetical protein
MNMNIKEKLEQKRKELVEFITLHDSDLGMKEDYVHIDSILTRQLSYISKYHNGDIRIQKLNHGSVNRFSHNAENLYFSLAMYPDLFQKILEAAQYEIVHIDVAKKGGIKETKDYIRLTDIASTTEDCLWYRIKPDLIRRLCTARDLLKEEIKKEIEKLTASASLDKKEELPLPSSFKIEDRIIVVTDYIDHDMFWIVSLIKADMELNISADSSKEEIETAMCGRVADKYLDQMIEDAISKNKKDREEVLRPAQSLPAKEKVQWLYQNVKISISMMDIDSIPGIDKID